MPMRTEIKDGAITNAYKPLLPKSSTATDTTLEAYLKHNVSNMIAAINARYFHPSSPAWASSTSDFTSEPAFHLNEAPCTLEQFLTLFDEQTRDHPAYFCRIREINVHVNSKRDHAVLFADVETNGLPTGIVRPAIGVVEFELVEGGEWKCRKFRCMPRMEVLGGERGKDAVGEGGWG